MVTIKLLMLKRIGITVKNLGGLPDPILQVLYVLALSGFFVYSPNFFLELR